MNLSRNAHIHNQWRNFILILRNNFDTYPDLIKELSRRVVGGSTQHKG